MQSIIISDESKRLLEAHAGSTLRDAKPTMNFCAGAKWIIEVDDEVFERLRQMSNGNWDEAIKMACTHQYGSG